MLRHRPGACPECGSVRRVVESTHEMATVAGIPLAWETTHTVRCERCGHVFGTIEPQEVTP